MKTNPYFYMSMTLDPYTEDNDKTQDDLIIASYLRYKYDAIIDSIGTDECKYMMQHFYDELCNELTTQQFKSFFYTCIDKLNEYYHIDSVNQYIEQNIDVMDQKVELRHLINFFESEDCVDFIVDVFDIEDVSFFNESSSLQREYLNTNFDMFLNKFFLYKYFKTPFLVEILKYQHIDDHIDLFLKLFAKYKSELTVRFILKNGRK